jgi:hypothetical protein
MGWKLPRDTERAFLIPVSPGPVHSECSVSVQRVNEPQAGGGRLGTEPWFCRLWTSLLALISCLPAGHHSPYKVLVSSLTAVHPAHSAQKSFSLEDVGMTVFSAHLVPWVLHTVFPGTWGLQD